LLLSSIVSSQEDTNNGSGSGNDIQHDNNIDSIIEKELEQANHDIAQSQDVVIEDTNDDIVEATITTNDEPIEPIVETIEPIAVTKEEPIISTEAVSIETKQSNQSESTTVDVNNSDIKIVPKLIKQLVEFFITFPKSIILRILNIFSFKSK
jgi:hypothetical protein